MARPRKLSPANYNVQTNLNINHLAFAAAKYFREGRYNALKSTSTLIRTIVEDWVDIQGGIKIQSLDHAKEILNKLGLPMERRERTSDRGYHGNTYEDEEQTDIREEAELKVVEQLDKEIQAVSADTQEKAQRAIKFLTSASEEQMKKLIEGRLENGEL